MNGCVNEIIHLVEVVSIPPGCEVNYLFNLPLVLSHKGVRSSDVPLVRERESRFIRN